MQQAIDEHQGMQLPPGIDRATFLFPALSVVEAGAAPIDGVVQQVGGLLGG